MGLLFPAVLHFTHTELHFGKSQLALSRFSSCIMLVAYASYLFFQLKSQPNLYSSMSEVDGLILAVWFSVGSLFLFLYSMFFNGVIKCLIWGLKSAHISDSSRDEFIPKYVIVIFHCCKWFVGSNSFSDMYTGWRTQFSRSWRGRGAWDNPVGSYWVACCFDNMDISAVWISSRCHRGDLFAFLLFLFFYGKLFVYTSFIKVYLPPT